MKNILFKTSLFALACLGSLTANAQVKFRIQLLSDQKSYQISMVPETTWGFPENITSTAQITIVCEAGGFLPKNVVSLSPDVEWEYNSRTFAPTENPAYDYFSFGMKTLGTSKLNYQNGVEVPLFTFENELDCAGGDVRLINNGLDPLMQNPDSKSNVGNYISIFGANGDAYTGFAGTGWAPCANTTNTDEVNFQNSFAIAPNPVFESFYLKINWKETAARKARISLVDGLGRVVTEYRQPLEAGAHEVFFDMKNEPSGLYELVVISNGATLFKQKVVKIQN